MALYKDTDLKLFKDNIDDILNTVRDKRLQIIEPEVKQVYDIIVDFVKSKKRKVYGGTAQNLHIKAKNPKDAFYADNEYPDLEFYSPTPMKDLFEICNNIFKAGFEEVDGYEAQHTETYSIRVNGRVFADISYMPRNVYAKTPFTEIDGLVVVSPLFISIDFLRMFSDPLVSWQEKLSKRFERFCLLQKYYPYPNINRPLNIVIPKNDILSKALNVIDNFLINRKTAISIGFHAYNFFVKESKISQAKTNIKFTQIKVPYYEIISSDYKEDALSLISELKKVIPDPDFKNEEHYPFFQFTGYSVYLFYKDILLGIIYDTNKKCVPSHKVPVEGSNGNFVNIGSFTTMLLYSIVNIIKSRVDDDDDTKNLYYTLVSHLIELRNYHFKRSNTDIFTGGIFADFIIDCIGISYDPRRERGERIKKNIKKGKPPMFAYRPRDGIKESTDWTFLNSSGNPISNFKNLKLELKVDKDTDDEEDTAEEKNDQEGGKEDDKKNNQIDYSDLLADF